jgi:hypothetical protein
MGLGKYPTRDCIWGYPWCHIVSTGMGLGSPYPMGIYPLPSGSMNRSNVCACANTEAQGSWFLCNFVQKWFLCNSCRCSCYPSIPYFNSLFIRHIGGLTLALSETNRWFPSHCPPRVGSSPTPARVQMSPLWTSANLKKINKGRRD